MSSQTRNSRGGTTGIDLRTLLIASVASAVAAIVVSRIWASGTPIAAAMTPVLVTLLKEVLDRPTAAVAARVTAQTRALPHTDVREPVPARVADRMRGTEDPARTKPPSGRDRPDRSTGGNGRDPDEIRVYRSQPAPGRIAQRINPKVAIVTGLLAFVIAGLVITGAQVLAGHGHGAIILGQHHKPASSNTDTEQQNTTTEQQQTTTTPDQQQTTTTPTTPQQTTTTPTTPQQTTPQSPTQTAPGGTPASP
jgi:hypothetical protein